MRLMIWVGDEGPTDIDLKDGDIWQVNPNTWTPSSNELKKWLVVEMAEYQNDQSELIQAEYTAGEGGVPVIRHMRKYYVPYWLTLTPEELIDVRNKTLEVPVMADRFDMWDITRK